MGEYDPIRERMARLSEAELRSTLTDTENWSQEARAAAYAELVGRGITDAPDPSSTPISVQRSVHRGDAKDVRGKVYVVMFLICGALWLIATLLGGK